MPLATVHLVALARQTTVADYVNAVRSSGVNPYVISRAVRWIIKPEKLSVSPLLDTNWDLLIILPASEQLPQSCLSKDKVATHWSITAGVPSGLTKNFHEKNKALLYPPQGKVVSRTGETGKARPQSSSQALEVSDDLLQWSKSFKLGSGAMSMLNLLAFKPGKEAHESYLRYGKAFGETIGAKRGGNAKIVGKVVKDFGSPDEDKSGWDEIALAHYPSIAHFTDMLASADYQKVNHDHRLPALRDTCILCTSELDPELGGEKAKL